MVRVSGVRDSFNEAAAFDAAEGSHTGAIRCVVFVCFNEAAAFDAAEGSLGINVGSPVKTSFNEAAAFDAAEGRHRR